MKLCWAFAFGIDFVCVDPVCVVCTYEILRLQSNERVATRFIRQIVLIEQKKKCEKEETREWKKTINNVLELGKPICTHRARIRHVFRRCIGLICVRSWRCVESTWFYGLHNTHASDCIHTSNDRLLWLDYIGKIPTSAEFCCFLRCLLARHVFNVYASGFCAFYFNKQ